MIINIDDSNKEYVSHALRVAIDRINSSLSTAFSDCHPDRHGLRWYMLVEDNIRVMKQLKRILDKLEEAKGETI